MKKIFKSVFICLAFGWSIQLLAGVATPVGFWKTIDDVSGQPKAIIKIWKSHNQLLYGQIMKIFPDPGHDEHELCTACKGEKHNKPIVGLVIMENLQQNDRNQRMWGDGKILDPKSGKIYSCKLKVAEDGRKMQVTGYIGFALLGRTQTWLREKNFKTEP